MHAWVPVSLTHCVLGLSLGSASNSCPPIEMWRPQETDCWKIKVLLQKYWAVFRFPGAEQVKGVKSRLPTPLARNDYSGSVFPHTVEQELIIFFLCVYVCLNRSISQQQTERHYKHGKIWYGKAGKGKCSYFLGLIYMHVSNEWYIIYLIKTVLKHIRIVKWNIGLWMDGVRWWNKYPSWLAWVHFISLFFTFTIQ